MKKVVPKSAQQSAKKRGAPSKDPSIAALLGGRKIADIRKGFRLAREQIPAADKKEVRGLYEMLSAFFYIDKLDHPEFAPMIDEAMDIVAALGPSVIPLLVKDLGSGDVKAEMVAAKTLGNMGAAAIDPLIKSYKGTKDPVLRSFFLFALSKIEDRGVARAVPLALESARSKDLDLRDTAVRTIGKFAEAVPPGGIREAHRSRMVGVLQKSLADLNPGIRAKAVRSLGKLAVKGHLTPLESENLWATCNLILGKDENFAWDRAYLVRREAEEVLGALRGRSQPGGGSLAAR